MRHEQERGQVLPLVALALAVMIGAAALAVDVGYLRYQQRVQQAATDSAAVAGASELAYGADPAAAARADATASGYTENATTVTVRPVSPPGSGPYSGDTSAVEVIVRKQYPLFFAQYLNLSSQWIATRAVARAASAGSMYCMYALKTTRNPAAPSGKDASASFNSDNIDMANCGLISNGSLYFESSNIKAGMIGYAGSLDPINSTTFSKARPAAALGVNDPCPTIPSCRSLTDSPPATTPCTPYRGAASVTPGIYCGIALTGNVTFQPGLYVLTGDFTGNGMTINGTGVTFYQAAGKINLNSMTINLSAPTSGQYSGMLFYQPASNTNQAYFESSNSGSGTLYFPNAYLHFNSNSLPWAPIIAGWIYMESYNGTLSLNGAVPGARHGVLSE